MFPLRDVHKPKHVPFITRLLILSNVIAFGWQLWASIEGRSGALIAQWGVRPKCYLSPNSCGIALPAEADELWQPILVSLFLHGGLLHIAFNMLFLAVFGPGVEDRLGRGKYVLLYFVCGVAATLAHVITHPASGVPAIGASGAIAGVLGAYFILLPKSWILTYFPPIFLFPVPAPLFLFAWIAGQVVNAMGLLSLGLVHRDASDVAWMAHIGGFLWGAAWAWTIKPWWKRTAAKTASRTARAS
ncbi:MAG: hypothetical protein JWN98_2607 [Abditibacteriota bacterium]|nr:hypothetical protein [Abditibacteriota bacterium]